MPESIELTHDECEKLLRAGVAGRVAVATPDGPHIIPINYSVVDDAIILRTSPYSLLGTYGRDAILAFEIDYFDHEYHHGWSVVVRGRASYVTDPQVLEHIRAIRQPRPWPTGSRNMHVRIPWTELSGRRLGTVVSPMTSAVPMRPADMGDTG
jgi:nitroimidazol reductase NimA-like FMN-containing flavoprotein (pyridoxamine 5'-phosphate oxidase superfamily)